MNAQKTENNLTTALNVLHLNPLQNDSAPSLPTLHSKFSTSSWLGHLTTGLCSAENLTRLNVPPRQPILGDWFRQGDLGFIYGPRDLGKTWLALHLARQCAEGGQVGPWTATHPRRVLYVDGEMPLDEITHRDTALSNLVASDVSQIKTNDDLPTTLNASDAASPIPKNSPLSTPNSQLPRMFYLHHEALFHRTGQVLNLTLPDVQDAILNLCQQNGVEILFLDNLSCLFSGLKENDADAWEQVLPWLLNLRRNRIAVVFIAHAGRSGTMRGTSRREDAAFWVIQLSETRDHGEPRTGAKFLARFVKNRNSTPQECPALEWQINKAGPDGRAHIQWRKPSPLEQLRQWLEAGLNSASEIATEMQMSKGQISKLAHQAQRQGWLTRTAREYHLK